MGLARVLPPNYQHCWLVNWRLVAFLFVCDLKQVEVDASVGFADGLEFDELVRTCFSYIPNLFEMRYQLRIRIGYCICHIDFILAIFKLEIKRHSIIGFPIQIKQNLKLNVHSLTYGLCGFILLISS